ncbi:hypothetical protein PFISCL1PPCAC_6737, partial [Pristionchus fissidentatus]
KKSISLQYIGRGNDAYLNITDEKMVVDERSASSTYSVLTSNGWQVGDRCVWSNEGEKCNATIRWIGRLRGHSSIYAGLEFDKPIGEGTGMYQGVELFKTANDYAAFVMVSTLSLPSTVSISCMETNRTMLLQSIDLANYANQRIADEKMEGVKRSDSTYSFCTANGWRVGDRCVWSNEGKECNATIRWIGRLRGHSSI